MINLPVLATLSVTLPEIILERRFDDTKTESVGPISAPALEKTTSIESIAWYSACAVIVYFMVAANYNMVRCETTDPGIIPARKWPSYVDKKYAKPRPGDRSDYYTKVWLVNQRSAPYMFSFTFCKTCQIWQPPRTNHCPICRTCVLVLDHHCHWLGTCLGVRNYHVFYWYLFHLVFLCFTEIVYSAVFMWRVSVVRSDEEQSDAYVLSKFRLQELVVLPVVAIYTLAIGQWVAKLFVFHQFYRLPMGRTQYELIKGHQANFKESPHKAGSSGCVTCCRIACRCCLRKALPASRMSQHLEMASRERSRFYSLNQIIQLREVGYMD